MITRRLYTPMRLSHYALATLSILVCVPTQVAYATVLRSIDGIGNNIANPDWGATETQLMRLSVPAYEDGISVPRGGFAPSSLPSPRAVSNAVVAQTTPAPNAASASDWLWQWGQFIDHDIVLTRAAEPAEHFDIIVPAGDPIGDIPLTRTAFDPATGTSVPRQQINKITSFIDGSNVYGSDLPRADALRSGTGGLLDISTADNGESLLPRNTAGLPVENVSPLPDSQLYLAGDIRATEQVGLTAVHTLFVREHNRIAEDIGNRLIAGESELILLRDSSGLSTDNFIYETARAVVGAQIQAITYNEFLPLLIGSDVIEAYTAYDSTVNAGISNEFATAAYRLGHTLLSPQLQLINDTGPITSVSLRDAFFNPEFVQGNGVDSLLLGLASQEAQELDHMIVDDVRNFLFGPPGAGGMDLASINIQRGRDHGIPSLNDVRRGFGLDAYASFLELVGGDADLASQFALVYDSVDEIDLWIGGLAELHMDGAMVGQTFQMILADQFTRLRDGDRFFYLDERVMEELLVLAPDFMDASSLSDVIRRNSSITTIQDNAFVVPGVTTAVPEPVTAVLSMMAMTVLAMPSRSSRRSK